MQLVAAATTTEEQIRAAVRAAVRAIGVAATARRTGLSRHQVMSLAGGGRVLAGTLAQATPAVLALSSATEIR